MRYLRQLGIFFVLLLACSVLIYSVYTSVEEKTLVQVNSEQMVHAEQAAQGIQRFFATYNSTLTFLAGDHHIIANDPEGRQKIRDFYTSHADEISSVSRVDENGIILYTYPFESSTGANISGQDHVKKTIATKKVVISDVFTSVQGFRTIAFAMPVFEAGTFKGSISLLVPFDSLARKNLEPIRVLSSGHAWTISQNGMILYSPLPNMTDRNAYAEFEGSPSMSAFLTRAMTGHQGSSSYTIYSGQPGGNPVMYEAVYNPVRIGDQYWTIVIATPRSEILGTLQNFRRDLTVIFVFLGTALFFFTYYIVRAHGIVREEERRQAAEDALKDSERKYRIILENIQDVYYRTDTEGRLTLVSPSLIDVLGYSPISDLYGKSIADSLYANPDDRIAFIDAIEKKGFVTNYEVTLKKKDGTPVTVITSSHKYYGPGGSFLGIEGVFRNITDRKRAETALQLATRKLSLISIITTTNIRNAVFTLSGYLELEQLKGTEQQRNEYHKRELTLLYQINHWLNIAKSYQDLGLNPPKWQNINTTFIYAASHLDFSGVIRKVDVAGLEIFADPMLETVFTNLAENVLVHAKSATLLTLRYEETPRGLTIFFEDNGKGIPGDMKNRIFEREITPANGMGLFMAREILEITGIAIRETGTFGEGARFEIIVPREGYRSLHDQPGKTADTP